MINLLMRHGKSAFWIALFIIGILRVYSSFTDYNAQKQPQDFRQIYHSSNLLLEQENPYSDSLLKKDWQKENPKASFSAPGGPYDFMVYPPQVFAFSAFFSLFTWAWAGLGFQLITGLCFFGLIYAFHQKGWPWYYTVLLLLAFKGGIPSVLMGNPIWICIAAMGLSFWWGEKQRPLIAGFFLALAAIKTSVVFPLVLLFLAQKKWKILWAAAGFGLGMLAIAFVLGLQIDHIKSWWGNLNTMTKNVFTGTENSTATNLTTLWIYFSQAPLFEWFWNFRYLWALVLSVLGYWVFKWRGLTFYLWNTCLFLLVDYHLLYDLILLLPVVFMPLSRIQKIVLAVIMVIWVVPFPQTDLINFGVWYLPLTVFFFTLLIFAPRIPYGSRIKS